MRANWRSAWIRLIGSAAALTVAAGCSGHTSHDIALPSRSTAAVSISAPSSTTTASSTDSASGVPSGMVLVAEPSARTVDLYATPVASRPLLVLSNPWLLNGVSDQPIPQALLVLSTPSDGWVEVQLPVRPNGSVGWLAPGTARLLRDPYRIEVTLHLHRITVFEGGTPLYAGPVATGAPATPTPVGLFYIRVLLRTTDPSSVYGPFAYGLSAHSEALTSFDGGDAEIGVHGNNNASVLGQSVTHGCVRMDNTEISRLAAILPLGTPVQITA